MILSLWRYDTRHNHTQHNDNQHNDTQHNDIQHNEITFNIMAEHCYTECCLRWVSHVSPLSCVSLCWMLFCCVSLLWMSWRPLLQSEWIKGGKFAYILNTLFPSDTYRWPVFCLEGGAKLQLNLWCKFETIVATNYGHNYGHNNMVLC